MKKTLIIAISFILLAGAYLFTKFKGANLLDKRQMYVLEINRTKYTAGDLWDYANTVLWEMEPKDFNNSQITNMIVDEFVTHKLLYEEAKAAGITPGTELFEQLQVQLASRQGEKELKALTGNIMVDADSIARITQERLMVDALLRTVVNATSYISESEIKDLYNQKELPRTPVGEAHIMHIFSTDNDTIHLVAMELARGIQFSEMARKYSEGPESENGGDLGFIKESVYPEFFSAAFKLTEGETSAIIKSDHGYHIFRMVQYAKADRNTYESLKTELLAELYAKKREELIGEYIEAVKNKSDIKKISTFNLADLFPTKD